MKKDPIIPTVLSDDVTVSQERIARRAYELWESSGCPDGREQEFWFEAERQLQLPPVSKTVIPPMTSARPAKGKPGKLAASVDGVGGKTDDMLGHTGDRGTPSPTSLDLGPR